MEQFSALGMTNGFARGEENHIFNKRKNALNLKLFLRKAIFG